MEQQTAVVEGSPIPSNLHVVMVADDESLRSYGPVLRRLSVGLIDEVSQLSVLSLGKSSFLNHIPSPPVRVFIETTGYGRSQPKFDSLSRQISINCPLAGRVRNSVRAGRIAEVLAVYKPTLLHALSARHGRLVWQLSKTMQIPYVVSILGDRRMTFHLGDRRCGMLLPYNSYLARRIRRRHPKLSPRVSILPIGTHVPERTCCFDHADRRPSIFCCAKFEEKSGLAQLITAVGEVNKRGHAADLVLFGSGPAEGSLRKHTAVMGLAEQVHFAPPIDSMVSASDSYKTIFQDADIYVEVGPVSGTSRRPELLESMSVGNAVLVADGEGNDLVLKDKTALVFTPGDWSGLTGGLERLLSDRQYSRGLASNAQDYLRRHFLASHMIARLCRAYSKAIELTAQST